MSLFNTTHSRAKILVVQHSEHAPGGHFSKGLMDRGARLSVVNPLAGDDLPSTTQGFDGLVVLGGPQHAFDDQASPHFPFLMELMRLFDGEGKPVAGICLGCQLLARAHGGCVHPLEMLEFGFIQHRLTDAGLIDPLLKGIALPPLMEFHEDTFALPKGATLLMEGDGCRHQCFKVSMVSYGFQPHLEVDEKTACEWINMFTRGGITTYRRYRHRFDAAYIGTMRDRLRRLTFESARYCDRIAENWLALTRKKYFLRLSGSQIR